MPSVYVSRRVMPRVVAELEDSFDLELYDSEWPPDRAAVLSSSAGKDGLLLMTNDRVDDELLDAAGPQLRVVTNHAVGIDNVDLAAATRRGVLVTNTPDVLTTATAEFTMALILALLRRVSEGDRFLRSREPWTWSPTFMLGTGLAERTLGIVGLGRIGTEVARLAEAFAMRVVHTSRTPKEESGYEQLELDELLESADVVSLHCPLTDETRHLIGAAAFKSMRKEAFLVNTTRGAVVDEAALVEALREGELAGAALDVYEREPELHPGLLELENVVLAPHIGSGTIATREAMGMVCVEALRAVLLENRCPRTALNPEALGTKA